MYVPEFICGAAALMLIEVLAVIVYAIYCNIKHK